MRKMFGKCLKQKHIGHRMVDLNVSSLVVCLPFDNGHQEKCEWKEERKFRKLKNEFTQKKCEEKHCARK